MLFKTLQRPHPLPPYHQVPPPGFWTLHKSTSTSPSPFILTMNGYSKMRLVSGTKSRSIDFSDLSSFPDQTQKPISKKQETHDSFPEQEEDEEAANGNGERFGVVLTRNCSVSSTRSSTHHHHRFDKQGSSTSSLQSAVKKAFSVKRSSSVSERYCKIYDQSVTLTASPTDEDDEGCTEKMQTRSVKKDKRGKILKACKRFFGL